MTIFFSFFDAFFFFSSQDSFAFFVAVVVIIAKSGPVSVHPAGLRRHGDTERCCGWGGGGCGGPVQFALLFAAGFSGGARGGRRPSVVRVWKCMALDENTAR